jgi:hypothetical protein
MAPHHEQFPFALDKIPLNGLNREMSLFLVHLFLMAQYSVPISNLQSQYNMQLNVLTAPTEIPPMQMNVHNVY